MHESVIWPYLIDSSELPIRFLLSETMDRDMRCNCIPVGWWQAVCDCARCVKRAAAGASCELFRLLSRVMGCSLHLPLCLSAEYHFFVVAVLWFCGRNDGLIWCLDEMTRGLLKRKVLLYIYFSRRNFVSAHGMSSIYSRCVIRDGFDYNIVGGLNYPHFIAGMSNQRGGAPPAISLHIMHINRISESKSPKTNRNLSVCRRKCVVRSRSIGWTTSQSH